MTGTLRALRRSVVGALLALDRGMVRALLALDRRMVGALLALDRGVTGTLPALCGTRAPVAGVCRHATRLELAHSCGRSRIRAFGFR